MTVHGSCHCKATTFELSQAPTSITRCARGAGPARLMIGINARLLDDFDIDSLPVELLDGRNLL